MLCRSCSHSYRLFILDIIVGASIVVRTTNIHKFPDNGLYAAMSSFIGTPVPMPDVNSKRIVSIIHIMPVI